MSTEKLFYTDVYLQEFEAVVLDVVQAQERRFVILDRTAFYPEGGGQPGDTGTLFFEGGSCSVRSTIQSEDIILHEIPEEVTAPRIGAAVKGVIDWERRFDHMQQHSGEHIVSGMICSRYHCDNVGFHMGKDTVEIDFNARISFEELLEIEEKANRYIAEDHKTAVLWPNPEELESMEYRSKKELEGDVRIVSFPGADTCACCGTHVSGSAQIGMVKFVSAEKFHGGTRIEVRFGKRAFDNLSLNYSQNKAIGVLLSAKEEKTFEYVKKQSEELAELRYELNGLKEEIIELIAKAYKDKGDSLLIIPPQTPEYVRKLAAKVGEYCRGNAAVFSGENENYKYALSGNETGIPEMNRAIREKLNGRGGGKGGFAQGSVNADEEKIRKFWAETCE